MSLKNKVRGETAQSLAQEPGSLETGWGALLNHRLLPLLGLALAVLLAACGGEPEPSSAQSHVTSTVPPSPAPTQASTATPTPIPASPTATNRPQETAPARSAATLPAPTTTPANQPAAPTATPSPVATDTPTREAAAESDAQVALIRGMVEEYWGAFNDYDADHALNMLEASYRNLEEELIRRDIGRMKLFRVKLEMSEVTPPTLNAEGDYETRLKLETPIDSRSVSMVFRRIEDEWWIVFSDEVE